MAVIDSGRVVHKFTYNPSSLAKNTTASLASSNDVKFMSPGTMLSCRLWLAGGGECVSSSAVSGARQSPMIIRLRQYSGETSSPTAFTKYIPMPGSIFGDSSTTVLAQGYYQFPVATIMSSAASNGYGWELDVRNSDGTNQQTASAANGNPVIIRGELVTGHLEDHGAVSLVAKVTTSNTNGKDLMSFCVADGMQGPGTVAPGIVFHAYNAGATNLSYEVHTLNMHDFFGGNGASDVGTILVSATTIGASAGIQDNIEESAGGRILTMRANAADFASAAVTVSINSRY